MLDDVSALEKSPTAFFYCSRSTAEPERSKPVEIMNAILRQLAHTNLDSPMKAPVIQEYETRKRKADDDCFQVRKLSLKECTDLILKLSNDNSATIIIDALDECEEATKHELLEALNDIVSRSTELVKVLLSSRDDVVIVSQFRVYLISTTATALRRRVHNYLDVSYSDYRRCISRSSLSLAFENEPLQTMGYPDSECNLVMVPLPSMIGLDLRRATPSDHLERFCTITCVFFNDSRF